MTSAPEARGVHSPDATMDNVHVNSASVDTQLDSNSNDPQSLSELAPFLETTSGSGAETDDTADGPDPLSTLAPFLPNSGNDKGPDSSNSALNTAATSSSTPTPTSSTLKSVATSNPTATPATTSPVASSDADSFSALPSSARAGIIAGVVGFLLLTLLGLVFIFTRRRHRLRRAARVARQREKMDDDPMHAIADLPRPPFAGSQVGGRVVSYAPTLPPKDEFYAKAGETEGVSTIKPLDSSNDDGSESDGTGAGWRLRRGRERADTDALGEADNDGRRRGSAAGGLRPTSMAARHARTRSTGIDLATLNGPRLDDMVREEAEREEERAAQRAEAEDGIGYELQRVRSDSDPKLRGHSATQRSSRTVVLPVVPFAPTWREGVDSARTSVKSWGSWAWPSGKDGRTDKDGKDDSKV